MGFKAVARVRWCNTCCTQLSGEHNCQGELNATSSEQHGWRVNVDTPRGIEAYGVLIARSTTVWRARILTFPNVLWVVPGSHSTMKFVGRAPKQAEQQAIDYIKHHCESLGFEIRKDVVLAEAGQVEAKPIESEGQTGRDAAPRKLHRFPVQFRVRRKDELGVTDNISESGMSIITSTPASSGTEVQILMTIDGDHIEMKGSVVWSRKRSQLGRPLGMGIHFTDPPPEYRSFVLRAR